MPEDCLVFAGIDTNSGNQDYLDFYLSGQAESWVAVGFTPTRSMVSSISLVVSEVPRLVTCGQILWHKSHGHPHPHSQCYFLSLFLYQLGLHHHDGFVCPYSSSVLAPILIQCLPYSNSVLAPILIQCLPYSSSVLAPILIQCLALF